MSPASYRAAPPRVVTDDSTSAPGGPANRSLTRTATGTAVDVGDAPDADGCRRRRGGRGGRALRRDCPVDRALQVLLGLAVRREVPCRQGLVGRRDRGLGILQRLVQRRVVGRWPACPRSPAAASASCHRRSCPGRPCPAERTPRPAPAQGVLEGHVVAVATPAPCAAAGTTSLPPPARRPARRRAVRRRRQGQQVAVARPWSRRLRMLMLLGDRVVGLELVLHLRGPLICSDRGSCSTRICP